jgi:hypothetical protein
VFLSQNPHNRNMNPKLPFLLCLLAAVAYFWWTSDQRRAISVPRESAVGPVDCGAVPLSGAAPVSPELDADQLVSQSADCMLNGVSLHAKARFGVDLLGERLFAPGEYWQQGQGSRKARLEFTYQSETSRWHLLQVCDDRYFYWYRLLNGMEQLDYVDLKQLENVRAEPTPFMAGQRAWDSVGGLASMLEHVSRSFQFEPVQQGNLDGIPVVVVQGRWRQESLARLLEGQVDAGRLGDADWWRHLPNHVPHLVRLTLGTEEPFRWFPYRVEFLRYAPDHQQVDLRSAVTLELYEVSTARDFPPALFQVAAAECQPHDLTSFYLDRVQQFTRR